MRDRQHGGFAALALGSLGVVFGDIGTSPLYTVQECVGPNGVPPEPANVLGILSLIFWSLTLVVTFKYVAVLMNADNHGEGGIMALLALVPAHLRVERAGRIGLAALLVMGGASLLFGDGIITPAISVMSAMEGLGVANPHWARWSLPLTVVILIALFAIQSHGTGALGRFFGPVMLLWFITIGVLGFISVTHHPNILWAMLPTHGINFLLSHRMGSLHVLGSVVLAVTGGEALYADMGHFGRNPIRVAWLAVAFPCLVLCYFGQGAIILNEHARGDSPFFALVPEGYATLALVAISAAATVIASQGLISAVFSLTHQAIRLGYFPRLHVRHTSSEVEGQIYVPVMNWFLALACLSLVLIFQHSSRLAAAFGLAVSGTMAITSVVFFFVTRQNWNWPLWKAGGLLVIFLSFDLPFLAGTCLKFMEGGYIPFAVGGVFFAAMTTWCAGRSLLRNYHQERSVDLGKLLHGLGTRGIHRIPGLAVFMASSATGAPAVLLQQLERFKVLHEHVILLTVTSESEPFVAEEKRIEVVPLGQGFFRVLVRCGFMDLPDVPVALDAAMPRTGLNYTARDVIYIVGHDSFCATEKGSMGPARERLFAFMSTNSVDVTQSFRMPADQVVELGNRIDL